MDHSGSSCVSIVSLCCSKYVLNCFFELFSYWKWPTPLQITEVKSHYDNKELQIHWYSSVHSLADNLMPILTPIYPSINSAYNVSYSTLQMIQMEFQRGLKITNQLKSLSVWASRMYVLFGMNCAKTVILLVIQTRFAISSFSELQKSS